MYSRIIATLALSFIFYTGSGQISYHRLYETTLNDPIAMNDTIFYHMSSTTVSGDVYAMGTKRVGDSALEYEDLSVIFTKHDNKGNIDWSRELDLGQDTVKILGEGSVGRFEFNGTGDSILFVLDVEINGDRSEIFGKLDISGNQLDLKMVGGLVYSEDNGFPNVAPFFGQSDILMTTGEQPIISRIGLGDELIWSRAYTFTNSNGDSLLDRITAIATTQDSTIVFTGKSDVISNNFMVAELDSNGVQIWAESYTFPIANLENVLPFAIEPLTNGNIAVAGRYLSSGDLSTNGFVSIIDTVGSVLLSKTIFITEDITGISNMIEGSDGTLWISGEYFESDTIKYFTTNINLDGTSNWTTIYPGQVAGFGPRATSLLPVQATGGATLVGHGFLQDLPVLQVMKHDELGETPCSDTISIILRDLTAMADTLTSSVVNGGIFLDSMDFELNTFIGFSPPVLSINQYPPFCPNEPIDTLLIASVSGVSDENISYMWSTEEFTDTIRVMQDGQYSVTVTITEEVCYMMCDTVELTRLMLPQIDITLDNSRYCLERIIVLNSVYTPGADGPMYTWNTTETTPSIEVTEPGVYSVTVVDNCGEMATATIDVELPNIDPSVAIFEGSCIDGQINLIASYTGLGSEPQYTWSTNETTNNIFVTTEGLYSVTVTDECGGNPAIAEINFEFSDNLELTITESNSFSVRCNPNNPNNGHKLDALLVGTTTPSYIWSTEETTSTIYVATSGVYTVTATDGCQTLVESIEVEVDELPTSGEITFELDCNEENNAFSRIIFDATTNGANSAIELDVFDAEDQGISISQNIVPTDPLVLGNYFVVLSTCDMEELATLTVNAQALCGGLLRYPIAFFPGGQDEQSTKFGPIPNDTMSVQNIISNVEFKVFNRWGETVFESTDILDAWDGTHKGEPAPSEVYIWYVSYIVEGVEMIDKGDVTLIR